MKKIRDSGLTLVLLAVFLVTLVAQALTGWGSENNTRMDHGEAAVGLAAYLVSGEFLSALFENWESEFLQMSAYVILTAVLVQRGSAESKDPDGADDDEEAEANTPDAQKPRLARLPVGDWRRAIYERSLGIVLCLLFLISFVLHWLNSARAEADEALQHGHTPETALQYLGNPHFWFESFQNWQSEFLATAVLVVLSIWLRQKASPESKPVAAPHSSTGR